MNKNLSMLRYSTKAKLLVAHLFICLGLSGCPIVATSSVNVAATTCSTSIVELKTSGAWVAFSHAPWLRLSQAHGYGNSTIEIKCDENASGYDRTAAVTIRADDPLAFLEDFLLRISSGGGTAGSDIIKLMLLPQTSVAVVQAHNVFSGLEFDERTIPLHGYTGGGTLTVADLNNDCSPDLIVSYATANAISVLLGDGFGNFGPEKETPIESGAEPIGVEVADLNGDGLMDIVTANYKSYNSSILFGKGDGEFQIGPPLSLGGFHPTGLACGDIDEDGKPDAVFLYQSCDWADFFLGKRDGSFLFKMTETGVAGYEPFLIDLNRDGHLDMVSAGEARGTSFCISKGTGGGSFADPDFTRIDSIDYPSLESVGDFDNDGILDLIIASGAANGGQYLLRGKINPFNPSRYEVESPTYLDDGNGSAVSGDFNGDSYLDVAVSSFYEAKVVIHTGDGHGLFTNKHEISVGSAPDNITTNDFNHDGRPDLAVLNTSSGFISILLHK